jgi:hypothetical protein
MERLELRLTCDSLTLDTVPVVHNRSILARVLTYLQNFCDCLQFNDIQNPWRSQATGSPFAPAARLYDVGLQLRALKELMEAFLPCKVALAYKAPGSKTNFVKLLALDSAPTTQHDTYCGYNPLSYTRSNDPTVDEAITIGQGVLIVFSSTNEVYGCTKAILQKHHFAQHLTEILELLCTQSSYTPMPEHPYHLELHALAQLIPPTTSWPTDFGSLLTYLNQLDGPSFYLMENHEVWNLFHDAHLAEANHYCHLSSDILYSYCYEAWLAQAYGNPLTWSGRDTTIHTCGSLGTVFQFPPQVHTTTSPSMLLGSLEVTEVLAMDWISNKPAVFLKSIGFWRSEGALLIPSECSPLIAMVYMNRILNSRQRDLTKHEIGTCILQDANIRHLITELSNFYKLQSALSISQLEAIEEGLRSPPYTLTTLGLTYQEHVHTLLLLFLSTFKHSRFRRVKTDGVEIVLVLSVNYPDALSPEILAVAYVNEQEGVVGVQTFPSHEAEAKSFPHAKILELTATYSSDGVNAVRLRWANKSLEQPEKASPSRPTVTKLPSQKTSTIIHPVAPSFPTAPSSTTVITNAPTQLHVVSGPPPITATGVIVSMIRFGWDFTTNSSLPTLDEITAALTAANIIKYVQMDTEGSRDEYIRSQILTAREQHPLQRASSTTPFHTYEAYLAFTAPIAVGHGTDILSHYEVAKQSPLKWERTLIAFQCITKRQFDIFTPENRVLFSRTGNLGEANYDAYCMEGLKQAITLLLPSQAGDILILRTGLGQHHSRPSPSPQPGKRSNRGGTRVQSVGGMLTVFCEFQLLNAFIDSLITAITGPRGTGSQPQWTSFLQDPLRRHVITEEILRYNNPALISFGLLRFDLYLTTELLKIPVEPIPSACNVVDGQFFSVISLLEVPMTQVIHQLTVLETPPPDWRVCIGMARWPQPNHGDIPLFDFLPNRRGPCLLIITQREARLPTIRVGDRTYPLDAYNMHPIVALDRQTTTLGNLMFTAEIPNVGHYNTLTTGLCDLLRVPISHSIHHAKVVQAPIPTRRQEAEIQLQSYRDKVVVTSPSTSSDSSLTTTSGNDQMLATLTQTMSLFLQRTAERDRLRDEQQQAFNLQVLTLLQQREGGPMLPKPP